MIEVYVSSKQYVGTRVCVLALKSNSAYSLPTAVPGDHIDLKLSNNIVRQYSISNLPWENGFYRIAVLKEIDSNGGSDYIFNNVMENDVIEISHPRSLFKLKGNKEDVLLLAGGIGITPIISMAGHLYKYNINFSLHYYGRKKNEMVFIDILNKQPFINYTSLHYDDIPSSHMDINSLLNNRLKENTQIYACGPKGFLDVIRNYVENSKFSLENLSIEKFDPSRINDTGSLGTKTSGGFTVYLKKSQKNIYVEENKTIIDAIRDNGIEIETSCENGICGTCVTRLLEGEVIHNDMVLSDKDRNERKLFTPCVSRAKDDLIIIDL